MIAYLRFIPFTVVENEEETKKEETTPVKRGLFARFSSNKSNTASNSTIKTPSTPPNSPIPSTPTTEATTTPQQGKQSLKNLFVHQHLTLCVLINA